MDVGHVGFGARNATSIIQYFLIHASNSFAITIRKSQSRWMVVRNRTRWATDSSGRKRAVEGVVIWGIDTQLSSPPHTTIKNDLTS